MSAELAFNRVMVQTHISAASNRNRETNVTFCLMQAWPRRMQAKPPSPMSTQGRLSQRDIARIAMIVQSMLVLCLSASCFIVFF